MVKHAKELTMEQYKAIDPIELHNVILKVLEAKGTYKFHELGDVVILTIELPQGMISLVANDCPWWFPWCA